MLFSNMIYDGIMIIFKQPVYGDANNCPNLDNLDQLWQIIKFGTKPTSLFRRGRIVMVIMILCELTAWAQEEYVGFIKLPDLCPLTNMPLRL